ncbi:MAG: NADH-quinone oxidoreductase subunit L [Candidatus Marinimicrobia bacterium]|nr:NADH-quinone oxidoreductase subunit L [Candidatus Neomarinimicrobiota bacterium]
MESQFILAIIILFIPLVSFVGNIFFGKRLSRGGDWFSISTVGIGLLLSVILFFQMIFDYTVPEMADAQILFNWVNLGAFKIELGLLVDNQARIMLLIVSLVSFLVHIYSTEYMKDDPRYSRYFAFLSLFTFSMYGIVISASLFMIYIFWELVGLSSYLLIGFWFEKKSAADAGKKAFITNRIGDIGMFAGIMLITSHVGSFAFSEIYTGVADMNTTILTIGGILLFLGAVGKSAQFPLHVWLPDAMEGPTPVSALIHAATMVAAGVYLVLRIFPILTPEAAMVIAYTGGFTAFGAAIIALTQNDIKRVLAYSTVSQLGYMVMAIGVGSYTAGLFHLMTHAWFKACLFLGSGSVIHAMHHALHKVGDHETDPQDMRNMGGLKSKMPKTFWTFLIATVAIAGVPLTSGFMSKDAILGGTLAYAMQNPAHLLLPVFGFGAALMTAFYMFRQVFMTFYGKPANEEVHQNVHENPSTMTIPLIVLSSMSIFVFYAFGKGFHFNFAHGWFQDLVPVPHNLTQSMTGFLHHLEHSIHVAHYPAMAISVVIAGFGIFLAWLVYFKKKISAENMATKMALGYKLSFNKFFIDEIYQKRIIDPFLWLCRKIYWFDYNILDQKVIDGFGRLSILGSKVAKTFDDVVIDNWIVDGFGRATLLIGRKLRRLQTGKLQQYLAMAIVGVVILAFLEKLM